MPYDYTLGGEVADFFARNLRHSKGPAAGEPFVPEWHQQEFLDEFYRCDEQGNRVYRTALRGVPRGNGKSPECAGMALRDLRTLRDSPDVFCGAAAKDQGRILLDYARDFVETGPLRDRINVQRNILTCERTRGVMQVLSADGALQHGKSVSGWYGDEYHAFTTPKQRELHVAMVTALFKRRNSAGLMITTAGWDKATLLGEMYDQAMSGDVEVREDGFLLVSRDEENGSLFWWRQVPIEGDIEDPDVLRRANPASWIDVNELLRVLRSDSSGIGEAEFRRLHCNQWTASRAIWIRPEWWAAIQDAEMAIPEKAEVFLAVDASWSHDTTAVALAHRRDDGRVCIRVRVWACRQDAAAHEYQTGDHIRMEPVREHILDLHRRFNVREVAFDPAYFRESAEMLSDAGLWMVQLDQQTKEMRHAEQHFFDAVAEGQVVHDGDEVLRDHIAATQAQRRPNGAWAIRPLAQHRAIDATVAAVMAHSRALHYGPRSREPLVAFL